MDSEREGVDEVNDPDAGLSPLHAAYNEAQRHVIETVTALNAAQRALECARKSHDEALRLSNMLTEMMREASQ